jgi:hypothetical protein
MNIVGHDSSIMVRALALAIAAIPYLPEEYQARRDREDMLELLRRAQGPDGAEIEVKIAAETMAHIEDRYRRI